MTVVMDFIRKNRLFTAWMAVLAVMLLIGLIGGLNVLIFGLQQTNLSDQVPWGLWITLDLSAIASGGGAFIVSAVIYIFGLKRYNGLVRVAVLTGFLGYTAAMLALFVDIGQPLRFWHPLIYWNVHSPLWEITICVVIYFMVLAAEMAPTILDAPVFERFPWLVKLGHQIHHFAPVLAVLGLGLSLLHQSSLGATYGILVGRAVWFNSASAVLFLLSAAATGLAVVTAMTAFIGRLSNKEMAGSFGVLQDVAKMAGFAILAYLYLKLWDWATFQYYAGHFATERVAGLDLLRTATPYQSTFWLGEVLIGAVIPAIIFLTPALRRDRDALFIGGMMVFVGTVINRWNATLAGTTVPLDWSLGVGNIFPMATYVPNVWEIMVGIGIIAYWCAGFSITAKFFPLFPEAKPLAVNGSEPVSNVVPAAAD